MTDPKHFKCRSVLDGSKKGPWAKWQDTYSTVCRASTIRTALALTSFMDGRLASFDIKQAYLSVALDESEYYTAIPPEGMTLPDGTKVCSKRHRLIIKRALYGDSLSARRLMVWLRKKLESIGFKVSDIDRGLFYRYDKHPVTKEPSLVIVPVYVDDGLLCGSSRAAVDRALEDLRGTGINITSTNVVTSFIGFDIDHDEATGEIRLSTKKYLNEIAERWQPVNTTNSRKRMEASLPADAGITTKHLQMAMRRAKEEDARKGILGRNKARDEPNARKFIGECLYACSRTCFDLAVAVGRLAMTSSCPTPLWWAAARRLMRYIRRRAKEDPAIVYRKRAPGTAYTPTMTVLSDSSYNNTIKCRATCGWFVLLNGAPVSWKCGVTATSVGSTCGAESYAMSLACREGLMLRALLVEQGCDVAPMELGIDNNGALQIMLGANRRASAWFDWRICMARGVVEDGLATMRFVPTKFNLSDLMTKPMRSAVEFHRLLSWLVTLRGASTTTTAGR